MTVDIATYSGRIAKVVGPTRSGKTQACVCRCVQLLKEGNAPQEILVVVSSGLAAQAFRGRLAQAAGSELAQAAAQVRVERAIDVCSQVMSAPEVVALTGRGAHVLNDAEYTFFLEDLKTLGQKNQRLHNMLLFFFAQWSRLENEDEWLLRGEETDLLTYARRVLASLGGTLRHELPYLCARFLESEQGKPFAQRFSYVVCDDFQDLSYAEQICMALMARVQLIVAGCDQDVTKVNTDYPSPEGFERFERVRRGVEVFDLTARFGVRGALTFERALAQVDETDAQEASGVGAESAGSDDMCMSPQDNAFFVKWDTPALELSGLAKTVRTWLEAGCNPADVVVVAPTQHWAKLAAQALEHTGVRVSTAGLGRRLGGDPRTPGMHAAASAWAALRLIANPVDPLAWRLWSGFDNAITNSEAWTGVYKTSWGEGVGVCEVLARVARGEIHMIKGKALGRAWARGQKLIANAQGLTGYPLARAAGLDKVSGLRDVCEHLTGDEDARALLACFEAWLAGCDTAGEEELVHLCLPKNLAGQEYPLVVMVGMVDGMAPRRDVFEVEKSDEAKSRMLDEDRTLTRLAVAKAREALVVSTFARTDIETAEQAKMLIARITSAQGARVALVSPSRFFTDAGAAFPGFIDGEEFNPALTLA